MPAPVRCSYERLLDNGIYLVGESAKHMHHGIVNALLVIRITGHFFSKFVNRKFFLLFYYCAKNHALSGLWSFQLHMWFNSETHLISLHQI